MGQDDPGGRRGGAQGCGRAQARGRDQGRWDGAACTRGATAGEARGSTFLIYCMSSPVLSHLFKCVVYGVVPGEGYWLFLPSFCAS
jgi:hypothetical protein